MEEVRYTRITSVEDRKRTCDKRSHGHWEERTARVGGPGKRMPPEFCVAQIEPEAQDTVESIY